MKTRPCTKKQSPSQRVLPMEVFWVGFPPGKSNGLVESWAPKWNDHIGDTPHVETKKPEKMRGSGIIYFWKSWSLKKKHFATVDIGNWSHSQGSRSLLRFKQWTSMTMVSDLPWIFHCFWVEVGRTLPPKSILVLKSGGGSFHAATSPPIWAFGIGGHAKSSGWYRSSFIKRSLAKTILDYLGHCMSSEN